MGELAEREREEQALVTERREKEKRDAVFMKRVMEEQLELERQREMELDLLYQLSLNTCACYSCISEGDLFHIMLQKI